MSCYTLFRATYATPPPPPLPFFIASHLFLFLQINDIVDKIIPILESPAEAYMAKTKTPLGNLRKVWITLEEPTYSHLARFWSILYYFMLAVSLVHFPLTTVFQFQEIKPEFLDKVQGLAFENKFPTNSTLQPIEIVTMWEEILPVKVVTHILRAFFTFDLVIRFVSCPFKSRFLCDMHSIIDICLVVASWTFFVIDIFHEYYQTQTVALLVLLAMTIEVTRTLRTVHLAKHFPEMKIMYLCFKASAKELLLFFVVLMSAVIIFGTLMFIAENADAYRNVRWETPFKNIVISMWWAVITLTTVGYGDYSPQVCTLISFSENDTSNLLLLMHFLNRNRMYYEPFNSCSVFVCYFHIYC